MKKLKIIFIVVLALFLAIAGYLFFQANYIVLDGIHSRDVTQLDLRGTELSSPEDLAQLTHLTRLDIRDTGITEAQYQLLAQKLPGCQILWSVPFQGQYHSNDTTKLHISQLTDADLAQLAYFPKLAQIDATACTDLAAIRALRAAYPQLSVSYWVPLGAEMLAPEATALTLGNSTVEALAEALTCLPNVTQIDATGCRDYAALQDLQAQYPQCSIRYQVYIAGQELENTATTLTLRNPDLAELEAALPYLPALESVHLTGNLPSNQEIHALQSAYPAVAFIWNFTLCGMEVSTAATELDFSNIPMESTQEVESALPYFNNLEKVIMCDCGISNQEMDLLGQRNPDVRFVWTVSVGYYIRIRTDATYLMPHQFGTSLEDSITENLKYCVDMVCIDLGHNEITDISFMANMPHLKYVVLGMTKVADISPLANHLELEYLELFSSEVQDYTPLISCPNLRDLNICYSTPPDYTVLAQLTQLENLYMKEWWDLPYKEEIQQALPNVHIVFSVYGDTSATSSGWRDLPRYFEMRDYLGMWYMTG